MVAVCLLGGVLTVAAGAYLLNDMVFGEAQRRVEVALQAADNGLADEGNRMEFACVEISDWIGRSGTSLGDPGDALRLDLLREEGRFDYLHVIDATGRVSATARGDAVGCDARTSPLVAAALDEGRPGTGFRLVPILDLAIESSDLAQKAYLRVEPTERAREGGPTEINQALTVEAVQPIIRQGGKIIGAVRAGIVLNRNFALVDQIRERTFTIDTYSGKSLGTVTIFLDDVRIATNVITQEGQRAVGTRVSEQVYHRVLEQHQPWVGPAYVVGSWYISAYEPLRDVNGDVVGMVYVGILKERYDDMRRQALGAFTGIGLLVVLTVVVAGGVLSTRLSAPITGLTSAADRIAKGDYTPVLALPDSAERSEIDRLTLAFADMATALQEREEQLQASLDEVRTTSEELSTWNRNYLDTLEFITHELKNQIAALKINVLAIHGGYVGEISDDQKEALEDVHASIVRTEEMILNYLNLSRIEKGELQVRVRPVAVLPDVIRPVLRDLKGRFDEKTMAVSTDLPEDLCVQADPSLLQIVYENLLGNAAKYGSSGGAVTLTGLRNNGYVELHVRNDGQGVSPTQAQEMFQKFARVHRPGEMERGSGLGLYITREIIQKHGGNIQCQSEEGKWIDFVFTLPRHDVVFDVVDDIAEDMIGAFEDA